MSARTSAMACPGGHPDTTGDVSASCPVRAAGHVRPDMPTPNCALSAPTTGHRTPVRTWAGSPSRWDTTRARPVWGLGRHRDMSAGDMPGAVRPDVRPSGRADIRGLCPLQPGPDLFSLKEVSTLVGSRRTSRRPTQRQSAAARRRSHMVERLGKAQTPRERMTAAMEYARSTLAQLDGHTGELLANELVQRVIAACDGALAAHARRKETRR